MKPGLWHDQNGRIAMTDLDSNIMLDASAAKDRDAWLDLMGEIGEEAGYFRKIGAAHHALFLDNSPTLLVSFDSVDGARGRPKQLPSGVELADECDWSQLCILSEGDLWFRDPAVHVWFDNLIDEGFFENYDRVLFYGAGPAGYAAAAFSVTSPGARVLLLNPVATLKPAIAGWDTRYRSDRRLDFTSRYGYAPDMVEGAQTVSVVHDPASTLDAMHAALFRGPHVRGLAARRAGPDLEAVFTRIGILNHLICAAMEGKLTEARFGALWRNRRDDVPYLRALQIAAAPRPAREVMLCRNVAVRLRHNKFKKRLAELTGKTAQPPADKG
ncbi:hypothetical protein GC209_12020 [bacterium]|nr:hypothetical protein [bacterium]